MKFGGTSVADAERIAVAADIVRARMDRRPVVVISALAGVTDLIVQALAAAHRGDREALDPILADLERRHRWALGGSVESPRTRHHLSLELDRAFEDLRQKLRSIRILGEGSPRAEDAILALGEIMSAKIVCSAFEAAGIPAKLIDPRCVLVTDRGFGRATPRIEAVGQRCVEHIVPVVEGGGVPVVGGFVGATDDGDTTTLGRGGSDTTAAVLGAALGAKEIQIWTDVDGLMSADPRLVPDARTIARMSFGEAAELAFYGAKVLHPDAVAPAVRRRIPVRVLNSRRADAPGTVIIDGASDDDQSVVSVASRAGVRTLRLTSRRMQADAEFVAGALQELRSAAINPSLLVASEIGLQIALPDRAEARELAERLDGLGCVELFDGRAIIGLVGAALARRGSARAEAIAALARWEPEMLAAGASATSVAAVVPEPRLEAAVRSLHGTFLEEARNA